jgi:hypothetical protein
MLMDEQGCNWCRKNLDVVVGWLEEEAKRRKLPFVRLAAKGLVLLAVRNARKKERILRNDPIHHLADIHEFTPTEILSNG